MCFFFILIINKFSIRKFNYFPNTFFYCHFQQHIDIIIIISNLNDKEKNVYSILFFKLKFTCSFKYV